MREKQGDKILKIQTKESSFEKQSGLRQTAEVLQEVSLEHRTSPQPHAKL